MAISDFSSLLAKIAAPSERVHALKVTASTGTTGYYVSTWTINGGSVGTAPTTSVACDRTTAGALGQRNGGSTARRIVGAKYFIPATSAAPGTIWLCDRLVHSGGLSGTDVTAQTTNLPSAALPRYTSGAGVFAALEIYSTIGVTPQTFTCSYTNSAGASGQTSQAANIGNSIYRESSRLLPITLASGDLGIRSVESVTLSGSTGTVGNFGVTLYKPLMPFPFWGMDAIGDMNSLLSTGGMFPEILDDACLFFIMVSATSTAGPYAAELLFAEDDT